MRGLVTMHLYIMLCIFMLLCFILILLLLYHCSAVEAILIFAILSNELQPFRRPVGSPPKPSLRYQSLSACGVLTNHRSKWRQEAGWTIFIHDMEPPRVKRTTNACKQCRARKVKCSGTFPCTKCQFRHQECVFEEDRKITVSEEYALWIQHCRR